MNHLEPLSWPAPQQAGGLLAHAGQAMLQQHLAATLSLSVRSTFRTIATFLEECRQSAPQARLTQLVHTANQLAHITFDIGVAATLIGPSLRSECERCLDGLDRLANSISAVDGLPHWEIAHGLDTLIALLVELDRAGSKGSAQGRALRHVRRRLAIGTSLTSSAS